MVKYVEPKIVLIIMKYNLNKIMSLLHLTITIIIHKTYKKNYKLIKIKT